MAEKKEPGSVGALPGSAQEGGLPMQDERTTTIAVEVKHLQRLAYFAAQGILMESEHDDLCGSPDEADRRAELGQALAMAYGYANEAADALSDDDEPELPYDQTEILNALSGQATSRQVFA
jgi:hypothetical protein